MKRLTDLLEGRREPTTLLGKTALQLLGGAGHLYGMAMQLRAALYRHHLLPAYRAPCPVLSVGNLSAGGTGKTPMVLWLAQQLRHKRLTIVSRGYGTPGNAKGITVVADPDGVRLAPPLAADEATLLARNLPGVALLTGADRSRLIRFAVEQYASELILMDDGFQHLRVQRDLDLLLMDGAHPLGNGFLLPGGILRERPQALHRCDAILLTRCGEEETFARARKMVARIAPDKPILRADHQPRVWLRLGSNTPLDLDALADKPVLAFCGIARPDSFARLLAKTHTQTTGWQIFPDHFCYTRASGAALVRQAQASGAEALVCTEKDAVKMDPAWLHSAGTEFPLFFLQMAIHFPEKPLWLLQKLQEIAGINSPDAAPRPPA
ncbi:MAG: tetraacyldisaccharide 4'-kinase [Magnetococcus sp. XQGC-1]